VPAVLRRDLDAYLDFLGGADIFSGLPKPFRPASLTAVEGHVLRFLSALHHDGVDLQALVSLSDAVSPALVKRGLQWLIARGGGTVTKHHGEIAWCLRCYAVKHLTPTPETAAFFEEVMPKLRKQEVGLSAKNQSAMAQFDDPICVERFLQLPERLWNEALKLSRQQTAKGKPSQKALLLVQSAVAVEILQFAPIRIQNLNHLRLDQHLNKQGRRLRINIPASEVKNGQMLEFFLNEAMTERIERYIKDWRCLFLPASNPYLFPGRKGRPKDQSALRNQIEKALWDHAAIRLTPHQFRHAAAKIMLDARPGHYEVVRKLLGHKTMTTTYNHYAGAETQSAVEFYGDVLIEQRRIGATRKMQTRANSAADLFLDPLSPMGKQAWGQR
jgi:integrase